MPVVLRQQIASLFLILLILLMIDKKMDKTNKAFLFIILGASLVVSHYGLSYIYMFAIAATWLILALIDIPVVRGLIEKFQAKLDRSKNIATNLKPLNTADNPISSTFVLLFVVFALTWYIYTSGSVVFDAFVTIGVHIKSSLITGFLNPEYSSGLALLLTTPKPGALHMLNTIINYLNQVLLVIGVLVLLLRYRQLKFTKEYATFSVLGLAIIFAGVFLPYLTRQINMDRLYYVTLIFLAPFPVISGLAFLRMIGRVVKVSWKRVSVLSILSIYFVVFFLFQTGFVWQVTEGYSGSVSLSQEGIKKLGDMGRKARLYLIVTAEQDVFGAEWLSTHREFEEEVYAYTVTQGTLYSVMA